LINCRHLPNFKNKTPPKASGLGRQKTRPDRAANSLTRLMR
jgi:hypothetical protein